MFLACTGKASIEHAVKETDMLAVFALEPVPMGYSAILDAVAETNGGENSVTIRLRLSRKCLKVANEIS